MPPAEARRAPLPHPADRLLRQTPGEHIGEDGPGMARRWGRDRPLERPSPVPARDAAELRTLTVRMTTRLAEAKPNAPLLIRLVRHPYALDLGRGKRVAYRGEDPDAAPGHGRRERVDWHAEIRAALADRERVRSTSGVEPRPLPFTIRPSIWKLLPDRPAEPGAFRRDPGERT